MSESFLNDVSSSRILFGSGTLKALPGEVERLRGRRALIVSTPPQSNDAHQVKRQLGSAGAAVYDKAAMHTPLEVTQAAIEVVEANNIDCVIGIGGGSTTGLCKAIAYRTGLPQIILPTTYAGSEMTPILGQTEDGVKTTLKDDKVKPATVIYDIDLTLSLPPALSGTSGINAIAHAVEAMYAENREPTTSGLAEEGIRRLSASLPVIANDPRDLAARTDALYGAALCGICLANVGMALHHKLCHALGGSFDLPHAETHTAVLPHAMQYNATAEPGVMQRIAEVIQSDDAPLAVFELGRSVGATMALRDLGLKETDLDRAADIAVMNRYWNPRPVEKDSIRALLQRAWSGDSPT